MSKIKTNTEKKSPNNLGAVVKDKADDGKGETVLAEKLEGLNLEANSASEKPKKSIKKPVVKTPKKPVTKKAVSVSVPEAKEKAPESKPVSVVNEDPIPVLPDVMSFEELLKFDVTEEDAVQEAKRGDEEKSWAQDKAKSLVHAREKIEWIKGLDLRVQESDKFRKALAVFRKIVAEIENVMKEESSAGERLRLRVLTEEIGRLMKETEGENGEKRHEFVGTTVDMFGLLDRVKEGGRFHEATKEEISELPAKESDGGKKGKKWPSGAFFVSGNAYLSNIKPENGNKLPPGQEALYGELRKLAIAFRATHLKRMQDPETVLVGAEKDFTAGVLGTYFLAHGGYNFSRKDRKISRVFPAQVVVRLHDRNKGNGRSPFLVVELVDSEGSAIDLLSGGNGNKFERVQRRHIDYRWAVTGQIPSDGDIRQDIYTWSLKFMKHVYHALDQAKAK